MKVHCWYYSLLETRCQILTLHPPSASIAHYTSSNRTLHFLPGPLSFPGWELHKASWELFVMLHVARSHHEQMQKCCQHRLSMRIFQSQPDPTTGCQREDQEAHPPTVFTRGCKWICPAVNSPLFSWSHTGNACSTRGQLQRHESKRDFALPRNLGPKLDNFLHTQPAEVLVGNRRKEHHPGSAQSRGNTGVAGPQSHPFC